MTEIYGAFLFVHHRHTWAHVLTCRRLLRALSNADRIHWIYPWSDGFHYRPVKHLGTLKGFCQSLVRNNWLVQNLWCSHWSPNGNVDRTGPVQASGPQDLGSRSSGTIAAEPDQLVHQPLSALPMAYCSIFLLGTCRQFRSVADSTGQLVQIFIIHE